MGHDVAFLALCRSLGLTTAEADTLWIERYGDKLVYTEAIQFTRDIEGPDR